MTFWIATYTHRHGIDVWPVFQDEQPTDDDIIATMDCFEADRDDEFIDISGPFEVPTLEVSAREP